MKFNQWCKIHGLPSSYMELKKRFPRETGIKLDSMWEAILLAFENDGEKAFTKDDLSERLDVLRRY